MDKWQTALGGVVILLLVVLTVQMFSISRHVFSLDNRLDSQTHADIQLLEARILVIEKDVQRFKGRDDVVKQITPLLEDVRKELKYVRTLQDSAQPH